MICAALPTVPPMALTGLGMVLAGDLTGAGLAAHAPDEHAGGVSRQPHMAHTVGGVGVRLLCPLSSLLGRVAGALVPAARFCHGGAVL